MIQLLKRTILLPALLAAVAASQASAQAVLTGTVREDSTGRRLAAVDVIVQGTSWRTTTNENGRYILGPLPAGSYFALFRMVGFAPVRLTVRVSDTDTVWANALLVPSALPLPELEVTAAQPRGLGSEGFEERRRMGFGIFIDSTELNRYPHLNAALILQHHGVEIFRDRGWAISSRIHGPGGEVCPMQIILDGVVLYRSVAATASSTRPPPSMTDQRFSNLQSIEVYKSAAGTPIEFGGSGAQCGTVVMWSKR